MRKIIPLVFFFSCSFWAFGQAQKHVDHQKAIGATGPQFKFVYRSDIIDFGGIGKNTSATYEFGFKNSGDQPLIITGIQNDSLKQGCRIRIDFPKKPIKPGKSGLITVTYAAGEEIGSFTNEVFVNSNATAPGYALLHISGAVVPARDTYDRKLPPPQKQGANEDVAVYEIIGESMLKIIEEVQK